MPAFHGFGTVLQIGDQATAEAFTSIALVQQINPPTFTRASIDVTHLASPSALVTGGHRERIAGVADSEPISLTIFYDPAEASHDNTVTEPRGLIGLWTSNVIRNFQIVFSDVGTSTWGPFPAFVSSFAVDAVAVDAAATATVELTITGEMTTALP